MKKLNILPVVFVVLAVMLTLSACGKKQDTVLNKSGDSTKQSGDTSKQKSDQKPNQTFLPVGYMYWMAPAILDTHWTAAVIGTVEIIDKNTKEAGDPAKEEVFGLVKIDRTLYSEPVGESSMEKEKYIRTDALKGFKRGDKVIIFFTSYKGEYAIKRGNILKISGEGDELVKMAERFLQNSQNTESILNDPAEYRLWGKYDVGTASRLMQQREEKEKAK